MRHILFVVLCALCFSFGGCVPYDTRPMTTEPQQQFVVLARTDGSQCVIKDGGLMEWATSTPGADQVQHERRARIRIESNPYYGSLSACSAEEVGSSIRGSQQSAPPTQQYYIQPPDPDTGSDYYRDRYPRERRYR